MKLSAKKSTLTGALCLKMLIIIAVTILTFNYFNDRTVLQIVNHNTGELLYEKNLNVGDQIKLKYIHSVTKQPVYEIFVVYDKSTLALKEMLYDSFGANLPVGPETTATETTKFIVEENYYRIVYENRRFDVIPLRVGQVIADHTLIFKDEDTIRLLDIVEGGAYVEVHVKPLIGSFWKGRWLKID
ncbi:DUF1850 domain-containing protein [Desulfitibacter alkalitolerans]|uniref:DUF1850 domain-containing protein n=1 Tax=Desulfitibacter alkalitolerans TaxID=264641 RepID=UPI000687847C|nr:DUF1850 domain-containing protein [Desulfitibacter alkalitolerans]